MKCNKRSCRRLGTESYDGIYYCFYHYLLVKPKKIKNKNEN